MLLQDVMIEYVPNMLRCGLLDIRETAVYKCSKFDFFVIVYELHKLKIRTAKDRIKHYFSRLLEVDKATCTVV